MLNKIYGFFIYNIYSLFFIEAFKKNVPYLFDSKLVQELNKNDLGLSIDQLGWGDHYILT